MRSHSYRPLSLAALALPMGAQATVYLTPEQAQTLMFPHQALRPDFRTLTSEQVTAIKKASGDSPLSKQLRAWRAADGGWPSPVA